MEASARKGLITPVEANESSAGSSSWGRRRPLEKRWRKGRSGSHGHGGYSVRKFSCATLGMLLALFLSGDGALAHGGGDAGGDVPRQRALPNPPSPSLLDAWDALLAARDGIAGGIEAGRTDRISEEASAIPDLARSLMQKTGDLNDTQRRRVRSGITQLSKVAEHLQMAADTGDAEVFRGDLMRIDRALRLIRAQYPEGSLPADHARGRRD